jgi:hypothetical protein
LSSAVKRRREAATIAEHVEQGGEAEEHILVKRNRSRDAEVR